MGRQAVFVSEMSCHRNKYAYVICITKDREQIFNLDIREE